MSSRARRRFLTTLALTAVAAALLLWPRGASDAELIADARRALADGRPDLAAILCRELLARAPDRVDALLLAAQAAERLGRLQEAANFFQDAVDADAGANAEAHFQWADFLLRQGLASQAEQRFRDCLRRDPHHVQAHQRLAFLLQVEARRWESQPHLFELLRRDSVTIQRLVLLGHRHIPYALPSELQRYQSAAPDDPMLAPAAAWQELRRNQSSRAVRLLEDAVARNPYALEAQAMLGRLLCEQRGEAFLAWNARLPADAEQHPEVWIARGLWALNRGEHPVAVRCFWEAARRDPNAHVAHYQLARLLAHLGRSADSEVFARRADLLGRIETDLAEVFARQNDSQLMLEVAQLAEALDRRWEAWAWYRAALAQDANLADARDAAERLRRQLDAEPAAWPPPGPAARYDLSAFPLPAWPASSSSPPPFLLDGEIASQFSPARFVDRATDAGLRFTYFNGGTPEVRQLRILETTGGGIGVLDYDRDGWPDLYFAQGSPWPAVEGHAYHDCLFRNLGDGCFQDVKAQAALGDEQYSQGVAVGDFDNDGWPDLYVANLGRNRLYRNNGDGTFSDVTQSAGLTSEVWTTSCLIADLNADGLPDLYDVNYARGDDLHTRTCDHGGARPQACPPYVFEAEHDCLLMSLGTGRFEDVTVAAGVQAPRGYGLGIACADFDGSGRLSLFVANDGTANFFFLNRSDPPGASPVFEERGLQSGLAMSGQGLPQACMGIAVGDANADGRLDLFVTNFYGEPNTLYLGQEGGLFIDASVPAGLAEPSIPLLGFGTQFLDAELDGHPDLVIANGNVVDVRHRGVALEMPPQYMRNLGDRFVDASRHAGDYFQRTYLGRALARLDWNRDGREDFVVTHLDAPVALLTNVTAETGHFLAVRLVAVNAARDAVGSVVSVASGEHVDIRQLTAGDGYFVSNERQLVFGLGASHRVETLTVRWPSGARQSFRNLPADRHLLIIEGRPRPIDLSSPGDSER